MEKALTTEDRISGGPLWSRRAVMRTLALLPATTMLLARTGEAGDIPFTGPIPRVESGMHAGLIRRIAMDAEERYVLSVSDDKTLRIWNRSDGKLQLTLRVPIGLTHNEGALYALAFSPDGRTVAVSGQTGPEWDDSHCIYLIDIRGGQIRRRITALPESVTHLAFSPNGAFLAAVFGEKAGLRVFGIPNGTQVYASEPYESSANWVAFSPDGRMITSAYDGILRLYDGNFRPRTAMHLAKGSKPHGVAFSPDGSLVAVGFRDRSTVAVLSGEDLTVSYLPDVAGVTDNLWSVAWSHDGKTLYAGGGHGNKGRSLIRWWNQAGQPDANGRGDYVDVAAAHGMVMQILPLKEGGLVFASADPALGSLDGQGFPLFLHERTIANFQGSARRLYLSERGETVEFDYDASGSSRGRFAVDTLMLKSVSTPGEGVREPRAYSKELRLSGGGGENAMRLNGEEIPLEEKEVVNALALDAKDRFVVLGTSYHLRLYTRTAQLRWKVATPGPVWGVNVSGNGQWVVAAMGDGTIRWFDAMRGDEIMTLFVHRDQRHWALWSPRKFFTLSSGAESMIGWHINRGKEQLADFHPVGQFPQFMNSDYFKGLFR
ncbi:MAG: hypothetical protein HQM00_04135 [Magnetococcales bacterium]|nr:hypothetical protein [Magnetococcales bacterium]